MSYENDICGETERKTPLPTEEMKYRTAGWFRFAEWSQAHPELQHLGFQGVLNAYLEAQ